GLAVRGGGDPFNASEKGACEKDPASTEALHDTRSPDADVGLPVRADAVLIRNSRATAAVRTRLAGHREPVEPQLDVRLAEHDARRASDGAGHIAHQATVVGDYSRGGD